MLGKSLEHQKHGFSAWKGARFFSRQCYWQTEANMQDSAEAKDQLQKKHLTLCIVKDGKVLFETASRGISGFLSALDELGNKLEGASVADKVAGKAIALLCVYAKVRAVFAVTLSEQAKATLEQSNINLEWDNLVRSILDSNRSGMCPFEKLAAEISNPEEAYAKLKALRDSMKARSDKSMLSGEHEQFISDEKEELKRIREKKLKEFKELMERMNEMNGEPIHITDSSFNEIVNKNELALVDFWAAWCGPCRALAPTIEEIAKEFAGKAFVGKLNVDENPATAERFQVYSVPTVVIMKKGKEVDRIVGCVPKGQIENALKKHTG